MIILKKKFFRDKVIINEVDLLYGSIALIMPKKKRDNSAPVDESLIVLKKREKISRRLKQYDREITDQSLVRVKMAILRSLERNAPQRTRLKNKQIQLSSSLNLSCEVKQLIDKIARAKKLF
ncbi:hypothetical protein COB21_01530 [Candidatus Aerophobetes bacterium]|uniref:Uncharacterized protein n=1 Tax=Aerophobetes bacterium TaxID=2030807 RepID=A0A2A4X6P2_UNCAE|nr:MAG: hypothetical protein COB21_01530 [Candidatus Aerophobetes bacterium]